MRTRRYARTQTCLYSGRCKQHHARTVRLELRRGHQCVSSEHARGASQGGPMQYLKGGKGTAAGSIANTRSQARWAGEGVPHGSYLPVRSARGPSR